MIFKTLKELIMKYFLQLIGCLTFVVMIVGLWSAALTANDSNMTLEQELNWYESLVTVYESNQINAHKMATAARELGYPETHTIILTAKEEWSRANDGLKEATLKIAEIKKKIEIQEEERRKTYPIAVEIYNFLKQQGYNEYVIAGILGNMMSEAGGQTLSIQVDAYSPGYYGICQWSLKYNPQLSNSDLNTQLNFLVNSMEYEFNTFGKLYKKGFDYEAFTLMTDAEEAALAFAKCYERCASGSYKVRQKNATKAFKFFNS